MGEEIEKTQKRKNAFLKYGALFLLVLSIIALLPPAGPALAALWAGFFVLSLITLLFSLVVLAIIKWSAKKEKITATSATLPKTLLAEAPAPSTSTQAHVLAPVLASSRSSPSELEKIDSLFQISPFEQKEANTLGELLLKLPAKQLYERLMEYQSKYPDRYRELIKKVDHPKMVDLMELWIKGLNSEKKSEAAKLKTMQHILKDKEYKVLRLRTVAEADKKKEEGAYYAAKKALARIYMPSIIEELLFLSSQELNTLLVPLTSFISNGRKYPPQNISQDSGNLETIKKSIYLLEKCKKSFEDNPATPLVVWGLQGYLGGSGPDELIPLLGGISDPKTLDCIIDQQIELRKSIIPESIGVIVAKFSNSLIEGEIFTKNQIENLKNYLEYRKRKLSVTAASSKVTARPITPTK